MYFEQNNVKNSNFKCAQSTKNQMALALVRVSLFCPIEKLLNNKGKQ